MMVEPKLNIGGEGGLQEEKPLSSLNKAETEALLRLLLDKYEASVGLYSGKVANQILNFIQMTESRLELYDNGLLIDTPKEVTKKRISILDQDF